ncbi:MAG: glycoside hydrolase family 20 zincin-like fold domain-containing protein, partial [Candidatus Neomarinimicrobiota bacterium]
MKIQHRWIKHYAQLLLLTMSPGLLSAAVDIIPLPRQVETASAVFRLTAETRIAVDSATAATGDYLRGLVQQHTGWQLPVVVSVDEAAVPLIRLALDPAGVDGGEGYRLTIDSARIRLTAAQPAGL